MIASFVDLRMVEVAENLEVDVREFFPGDGPNEKSALGDGFHCRG